MKQYRLNYLHSHVPLSDSKISQGGLSSILPCHISLSQSLGLCSVDIEHAYSVVEFGMLYTTEDHEYDMGCCYDTPWGTAVRPGYGAPQHSESGIRIMVIKQVLSSSHSYSSFVVSIALQNIQAELSLSVLYPSPDLHHAL